MKKSKLKAQSVKLKQNAFFLSFTLLTLSFLFGCSVMSSEPQHLPLQNSQIRSIKKTFSIQTGGSQTDSLAPMYPNPFNHALGDTTIFITFTIKDTARVKIIVQNAVGDSVVVFQDSILSAGIYSGSWEPLNSLGEPLRSGIYFITMRADPYLRNYISSRLFYIENND